MRFCMLNTWYFAGLFADTKKKERERLAGGSVVRGKESEKVLLKFVEEAICID